MSHIHHSHIESWKFSFHLAFEEVFPREQH